MTSEPTRPNQKNQPPGAPVNVHLALKAARLGSWELDPVTGLINWDSRCRALFGLAENNFLPYEQAVRQIHPDDMDRVQRAIGWAMNLRSGGDFDVTYRIIRADDGQLAWLRFTGQGYFDETGAVSRFAGVAQDVTLDMQRHQLIASEERFRTLIEEAPVATCLFVGRDMTIEIANDTVLAYWGKDRTVIGKPLAEAIPELKGQPFLHILDDVFTTGNVYEAKAARADLEVDGVLGTYYFDYTYKPLRTAAGEVYAIIDMAVDVTEQQKAEQTLRESEARFRLLADESPAFIFMADQDLNVSFVNKSWLSFTGLPAEEAQNRGWEAVSHPADIDHVIATYTAAAQMRQPYSLEFRQQRKSDGQYRWILWQGSPRFAANGALIGYMGSGIDIHERRVSEESLRASETKFRSLIEEAPVATCLFVGRDLRVEVVNEKMLGHWGKGQGVAGLPLADILPELRGQPFLQLLDTVFTTGQPYEAKAARAEIDVDGVRGTYYFDFIYKPLRDAAGAVYAIMAMSTEVTDQVLARQKIEAAQADLAQTTQRLMLALNAGKLGSYDLNLITGRMDCNPQCKANYGQAPDARFDFADLLAEIVTDDRPMVETAIAHALATRENYHAEYRIIWPDGNLHWVKASGHPIYSAGGQPARIIGVTQNITARRMAQADLEQQVEERTRQLLASVQDLKRSNENLQQFAYVASHDLQEPLRKIQSFGDLLKSQYADQLGEGLEHLTRMQTAASRMSTLIRDLLTYSRISTRQEATAPVSLTQVVNAVLTDLELSIRETQATIGVDGLPTIPGDVTQLSQLFQNLLSNALKFRRKDAGSVPRIQIRCQTVPAADLPPSVRPTRGAIAYYRIDVADNGVGFDEKYLDRIFQVFQRLHGKTEFAGTGIGLAICAKVAANHGGAITAHSQPGQGATFSLYLPH